MENYCHSSINQKMFCSLYLVYMHTGNNLFKVVNQVVKAVEKHMQIFLHNEPFNLQPPMVARTWQKYLDRHEKLKLPWQGDNRHSANPKMVGKPSIHEVNLRKLNLYLEELGNAIRRAYPDIKMISNCDGSSHQLDHPTDFYDFHVNFLTQHA